MEYNFLTDPHHLVQYDMYKHMIGKQVVKRSGKPFKSTTKVNTVKGIMVHPNVPKYLAFIFEEDESCVECWRCKLMVV